MTATQEAFITRNLVQWELTLKKLFNANIPEHAEWKDIPSIINTLDTLGSKDSLVYVLLPVQYGLDLSGARPSHEADSLEVQLGSTAHIIKPVKLSFVSFPGHLSWSYFMLEAAEAELSGIYESTSDGFERLTEIAPAEYIDYIHWDNDEYNGERLPAAARPVIRNRKGKYLIVAKGGPYNSNNWTDDGRHDRMTDAGFKHYIMNVINAKEPSWEKRS